MSRTDAHRPAWVQIITEPHLARESHDHRNGLCDLATLSEQHRHTGRWSEGRCYRFLDWTVRVCSCETCSGRAGRRLGRRRARVAQRALLAAARQGAAGEELDLLEGRMLAAEESW